MNHKLYAINLEITLEAPYLVHGNDPGRYGLDTTLLRDHCGCPVLPGTLIAGRIAETWHNLTSQIGNADADLWFGRKGASGGRSRLMVDDLILQSINDRPVEEAGDVSEITRIRENDDTGAVEPGALLVIEQIAKPGARLKFAGTWRTWASQNEIDALLLQLRAALLLQTQLGAYRGVGFGRLKVVDVSEEFITQQPTPLELPGGTVRYRLALRSERALCVGSRSRRGNVFESDEVITGGTILGTIATMLTAWHGQTDLADVDTALVRHFSQLRCTHALPAKVGAARPLPLPQSLVSLDDEIKDAWEHRRPPDSLDCTPAFQTDWKDKEFGQATVTQGWGESKRHLRVRTDIDGSGVAKEGQLFAYECIYTPLDGDGNLVTEWIFDLDLGGIPEDKRINVRKELSELLSYGLFPVGKTDAIMSIRTTARTESVWRSADLTRMETGGLVPVLLVTDALLFTTDAVADKREADLLDIYQRGFADLAGRASAKGALTLNHFFATQRLTGGDYLHRRYQSGGSYQPWVLTEAGSVFVFKVENADAARNVLKFWADYGLGLPKNVGENCGDTWDRNPYLSQTGYGEVAIAPQHGFANL